MNGWVDNWMDKSRNGGSHFDHVVGIDIALFVHQRALCSIHVGYTHDRNAAKTQTKSN